MTAFDGFIGGAYSARSKMIDVQECINFYPELESQNSKNVKALIGTPGLIKIFDANDLGGVNNGPVYGMQYYNINYKTNSSGGALAKTQYGAAGTLKNVDYNNIFVAVGNSKLSTNFANVIFIRIVEPSEYNNLVLYSGSENSSLHLFIPPSFNNQFAVNDPILKIGDKFNIEGQESAGLPVEFTVAGLSGAGGLVEITPVLPSPGTIVGGEKITMTTSITQTRVLCFYAGYKGFPSDLIPFSGNPVISASNGCNTIFVDGSKGYNVRYRSFFGNVITGDACIAYITDIDTLAGASHIAFIDGYYVANTGPNKTNGEFRWSFTYANGVMTSGTWSDLDYATAYSSPDPLLAIQKVNNELWMFGSRSIEIYVPSGLADAPFQRLSNATMSIGTSARYSTATDGKTVFWLGSGNAGHGIVYMATGFQPQRISSPAIECAIAQMSTVEDCRGYCYQQEGHLFYVMQFPTANQTWVYDVNTDYWHRRAEYDVDNDFIRMRGDCAAEANGKVYLGCSKTGKVYKVDLNTYTYDGDVIPSIRTAPHLNNENKRIFYNKLELDMEKGLDYSRNTGTIENDTLGQLSNLLVSGALVKKTYHWDLYATYVCGFPTVHLDIYADPLKMSLLGSISKPTTDPFTGSVTLIDSVVLTVTINFKEDNRNVIFNTFTVDIVGAQVILTWSNDGGFTWGNELWRSAGIGPLGQYAQRVIWRQLGMSRDRIFRVKITDPVKRVLVNAYLDVESER